jgi:O-antigen chain-terminating methyltransferase
MPFDNLDEQEILGRIRRRLEPSAAPAQTNNTPPDLEEKVFQLLLNLHQLKDPTLVPRETRFRLLKRLIQRLIRTYTGTQLEFNNTITYILNALSLKTRDEIRYLQTLTESNLTLQNELREIREDLRNLRETHNVEMSAMKTDLANRIESESTERRNAELSLRSSLEELLRTHEQNLTLAMKDMKTEILNLFDDLKQTNRQDIISNIKDFQKILEDESHSIREHISAINANLSSGLKNTEVAIHNRIDDEKHSIYDTIEIVKQTMSGMTEEEKVAINKRIDDEKRSIYDTIEMVKQTMSGMTEEEKVAINKRIDDEKRSIYDTIEMVKQTMSGMTEEEKVAINKRIDDERNAIYEVIETIKLYLVSTIDKNNDLTSDRIGHLQQMLHKRIDDEKEGLLKTLPGFGTLDFKTQEAKDHASRLADLLDDKINKLASLLTARNVFRLLQQEDNINDETYLRLEEQFRGSEESIRERQDFYLNMISEHNITLGETGGAYLDFGCGRGELLKLLKENDIPCQGVDSNLSMVEYCKDNNLDVYHSDGLELLNSLPDNHLRGIIALQVIEHLSTREIFDLLDLGRRKLQPGGIFVVETVNPESFYALRWFYIDYTHHRPLPFSLTEFLFQYVGFRETQVFWRSPVEGWRHLSVTKKSKIIDDNFHKLNNLLFGFQDYAVRGIK